MTRKHQGSPKKEKNEILQNYSVFGSVCLQNYNIQEELSFIELRFKKQSGSPGTKQKDGIHINDVIVLCLGMTVTNYILFGIYIG